MSKLGLEVIDAGDELLVVVANVILCWTLSCVDVRNREGLESGSGCSNPGGFISSTKIWLCRNGLSK